MELIILAMEFFTHGSHYFLKFPMMIEEFLKNIGILKHSLDNEDQHHLHDI